MVYFLVKFPFFLQIGHKKGGTNSTAAPLRGDGENLQIQILKRNDQLTSRIKLHTNALMEPMTVKTSQEVIAATPHCQVLENPVLYVMPNQRYVVG